jgi:hypothetical protein
MANRIALELIADANPLMKGLEQAQRSLNRFTDAAADAGHAIGGSLGNAIDNFMNVSKGGAAAAGVLAGGMAAAATAAVALTASAADQVDQLDRLSQKTGIAMSTLQGWSVIMAENGLQAESLTTGMKTLSKKIVEARDPASDAAAEFKQLGITIDGLSTTESVIRDLADRFKELPDGPEKSALAVLFLGKAGLELIPTLNKGSKALDESEAASKKYGAQLSDLQNNALKNVDTALDHAGVAANALKLNLSTVFAPAVEWAARMFADALGAISRYARDAEMAVHTLWTKFEHFGMAVEQIRNVLYSKDIFNSDAWKQALDNIALIDREAEKIIAKRRALIDVVTPGKGSDVAMGASKDAEKTAKVAAPVLARGEDQSAHIAEFKEVQKLTEQYRKGLIDLANQSASAIRKELDLYFETEKKVAIVTEQEAMGAQIVQETTEAWKHRNDALEMAVDRAKVVDEAQQALFQTEQGLIGASDIARMKRMDLIEAEGALQRQVIEETIFDEKKKAAAILNLDLQLETRRRQAIQQFPSFFEQQMQAIVQSNSFSIGQITTSWTSGLANAAVNGGNFVEQAWKSTQVAVLQGLLNFGIQKAAQLALQASVELGIVSATAASVTGLNAAKNATIVAGDAAAATATTGIWAGAGAAITGTFGAITGAITGFFTTTLIPFFVAIGKALMLFLSSIAGAASSTIFGIPYGVAILAGVAIIAAAIGSLAAFAFADGGIVTGPTMGLVGEAGSSEAVIPLNKRGAAFMREALGGGSGGGPTTVILELDGRVLSKSVFDNMPGVMRLRGVRA